METKTEAKNGEERGRDASKKAPGPRQDAALGKEPERGGLERSFSRDKDAAEGRSGDKPREGKVVRGLDRGRVRAAVDKKEAGREGTREERAAAPSEEEKKGGGRGAGLSRDKGRETEDVKETTSSHKGPAKGRDPRKREEMKSGAQADPRKQQEKVKGGHTDQKKRG